MYLIPRLVFAVVVVHISAAAFRIEGFTCDTIDMWVQSIDLDTSVSVLFVAINDLSPLLCLIRHMEPHFHRIIFAVLKKHQNFTAK